MHSRRSIFFLIFVHLGCVGVNDVDKEMKRSKDPNRHELLDPFAFSVLFHYPIALDPNAVLIGIIERRIYYLRFPKMQIERTVEINNNLEILKDLEMLSGLSLSNNRLAGELGAESIVGPIEGFGFGSPLERLGLFMKDEFILDEDEDAIFHGDGEEGEVFSKSSIPACS